MVKGAYPIIFLLTLCFFLSGCSSFQTHETENAMNREIHIHEKRIPSGHFMGDLPIIPIDLDGEFFHSVGDWYNETSILYIVNGSNHTGSDLYRYHLFTGEKELFYESSHPIITIESSENGNYFAVHSSSSINEANIVILDKKGNEQVNWNVESTELQYVWNPFNEKKLFITSFKEDWSFQNYLMDISNQKVDEIQLNQPFIQWLSGSEVLYLQWDQEVREHSAPLYSYHLEKQTEELVAEGILGFHTYHSLLMTISPQSDKSSYQFIDTVTQQHLQSFKLPTIETYSDRWWIPNYDYNKNIKSLLLYKPVIKDNQLKTLQLIKYSMQSGEEQLILDGVDDRPIHLSPDGELSLVGYQYEDILDLKTNELKSLIK
ncbi:hypothetical protein [Bacillus pinisoli]|uniref:YqgU-like beta propeller domain-containing protein n=1 Tax=Bacillus pinisoli TaxID=2901866 RepID=UPI001FF27226|nr:hypothetical protein [Bacillus pinisoli]